MSLKSTLMMAVVAGLMVPNMAMAQNGGETATANLKSADGKDVGSVELAETPNGVLLTAKLKNMPAGVHGFHIHAVGACEAPFKSAGGHYNPDDSKHGILVEDGLHAGDMPNIHVPESGALDIEVLNPNVTLAKGEPESLFDDDGSAIVVHEGADDYKSQPSGAAGGRIACGVIE